MANKSVCTKCGESIDSNNEVLLELSEDNSCYYRLGSIPTGHKSVGVFPFGNHCSMSELIETKWKSENADFTPDTVMMFGKHTGKKLSTLSDEYFVWIMAQDWFITPKVWYYCKLKQYIENNVKIFINNK